MNDTLESALDDEGVEEAADAEVDAVLFDITQGILGKAPAVPDNSLPVCYIIKYARFFLISRSFLFSMPIIF